MRFRYGVVCDEVRREDNGKLLLIGVYGGSIVVEQLPATLVLSLLLAIDAEGSTELAVDFRVMLDDVELRSGKGTLKLGTAHQGLIGIPAILLENIPAEGTLHFNIRPVNGDWETVASLPLAARKKPSS